MSEARRRERGRDARLTLTHKVQKDPLHLRFGPRRTPRRSVHRRPDKVEEQQEGERPERRGRVGLVRAGDLWRTGRRRVSSARHRSERR